MPKFTWIAVVSLPMVSPDDFFHAGRHSAGLFEACAHGQLDDEAELAFVHGGEEFSPDEEIKRQAAQESHDHRDDDGFAVGESPGQKGLITGIDPFEEAP